MRVFLAALAVLAVLLTGSIPLALQPGLAQERARGEISGLVSDSSGGVLPGVTVTAGMPGGQVRTTAVTDGTGAYTLRDVPAGTIDVTFALEGFASSRTTVEVQPGAVSHLVQRLRLAPLSETVVVRAPSFDAAPRPRLAPPPPSPPFVARPLPEHDRAAVCGPAKSQRVPESVGTIRSRRHEIQGGLYLEGAELDINGGLEEGLLIGRNLVVRRTYHARGPAGDVLAEHSAGVVQIVAATEHSSLAVVVYACDAMRKGDFLASFRPEPSREPEPPGAPAYDDAARILFADEGATLGVAERMMVIDRGASGGVRVGQRFTLFRQTTRPVPFAAGSAIVVAVRDDSATIRIESVTDAVMAGDWAAPQLSARVASTRH
jgi:hypothetical protein